MIRTLRYNGRLPGVLCEPALPRPGEAPITLDVAGFAGFAERGPLHVPVAVEDPRQYAAVFGADLLLARDGGRPVFAQLPAAVRAFFDNGGRRCYVVRVAGDAAYANRFRLPGVVAMGEAGAGLTALEAAWKGRWSDDVSVGTALRSRPLRLQAGNAEAGRLSLELELPGDVTLRPGDLLRVHGDGADAASAYAQVTAAARATDGNGVPIPPASALRGLRFSVAATVAAVVAPGEPGAILAAERLGFGGWEPLPAAALWIEWEPGRRSLKLSLAMAASLRPGDLLRLHGPGGAELLFPVAAVELDVDEGSPPGGPLVLARGEALLRSLPATAPIGAPARVELLSFDLYIREGAAAGETWRDLRFAAGAGGWRSALAQTPPSGPPEGATFLEGLPEGQSALLRLADPAGAALYLPIGMTDLPDAERFAGAEPSGLSPAAKDGLTAFAPALLLDPEMAELRVGTIVGEAERRLFLDAQREPPRGAHSLLPIDEVALIALPDAAHRPWAMPAELPDDPPPPAEPPPEPDWSAFQLCATPPPPPPPPPSPCVAPFEYELPLDAPPAPGLRQQLAALPALEPADSYTAGPLLRCQAALVRLCAARADTVAVLSMPEHAGLRDACEWAAGLAAAAPDLLAANELSYAALYHPWVQVREEVAPELAPLRTVAPDGAVCGMAAARALARGPWMAPANVGLRGVVGLGKELDDGAWGELFDAQVNLLRRRPGQFLALSAHTLSRDRQLVQLSVRRLLILLRKLALRRGMRYVFEPNNGRFRQLVQLSFERLMRDLAARGALVAYEVVTGPEVNTRNDADNGRFIVALKVAPTLPIGFITVTLLRSGEGLLELIER
jgi:hypothetical protein